MKKKFADLTAFIPRIKDDSFGEWIMEAMMRGTQRNVVSEDTGVKNKQAG